MSNEKKQNLLNIAPGFSIPANDYANQANAVLGIREAGKTYTAMKAAEQLLDCGIPIIVFDPVGLWKNLKIGTGGHKGYQIVVAGGEESDIRLTRDNAVDIVRAAMKENVSLVIDLYSQELINKSTWIHIVESTVNLLMYENKAHGLRHIFIEEAAEFIPQKIQPQQARVYAAIERLARMGRNARLGMTIINQRAEEVNKAILEICELSLIHKQVGKNSMLSIQKWLEVRQLDNVKEIIKSLPVLKKGECWAIGLTDQPQKIQVDKKKTFHPDPKSSDHDKVVAKFVKRDVKEFVDKMKQQLEKQQENKPSKKTVPGPSANTTSIDAHNKIIEAFKQQVAGLKEESDQLKKNYAILLDQATEWRTRSLSYRDCLAQIRSSIPENYLAIDETNMPKSVQVIASSVIKTANSVKKVASNETPPPAPVRQPVKITNDLNLGKCSREIIKFLVQYRDRQFSKAQVAIATGYSAGGGGFQNSLSELNQKGFILRDGKLQANAEALPEIFAAVGDIPDKVYDISTYTANLGKCEKEIYEVLLRFPDSEFTKEELCQRTESPYSSQGGGFQNSLSRLNSLELIERNNGKIRLNPELLELM